MNISAIVRSDFGGLGALARLFDHGLGFYRRLAINRNRGERGDFCREPDDRTRLVSDGITVEDAHWLCDGADVLISFEMWYSDLLPRVAKQMGVRTAIMLFYEMTPERAPWMEHTDTVLCTTDFDLHVIEHETPGLAHARKVLLPTPCDTERIKFHQRSRAEVFVHRCGHQGATGRNGTAEILQAWPLLKSPAKLLLYTQDVLGFTVPANENIEVRRANPDNYWEGFTDEGDVFLHPTRHDGQSLPIHEAMTAGLPVMAARWWPHCDEGERRGYLPAWSQENAVPVWRTVQDRRTRAFSSHHVKPEAIAEAVDRVFGSDTSEASAQARQWAEARSWRNLRGPYLEALA